MKQGNVTTALCCCCLADVAVVAVNDVAAVVVIAVVAVAVDVALAAGVINWWSICDPVLALTSSCAGDLPLACQFSQFKRQQEVTRATAVTASTPATIGARANTTVTATATATALIFSISPYQASEKTYQPSPTIKPETVLSPRSRGSLTEVLREIGMEAKQGD